VPVVLKWGHAYFAGAVRFVWGGQAAWTRACAEAVAFGGESEARAALAGLFPLDGRPTLVEHPLKAGEYLSRTAWPRVDWTTHEDLAATFSDDREARRRIEVARPGWMANLDTKGAPLRFRRKATGNNVEVLDLVEELLSPAPEAP
jgi:hypothetical protein